MFLAGTIVLLLGVMTVVGTLLSDLLLMWVDPRIRFGRRMSSPAIIAPLEAPRRRRQSSASRSPPQWQLHVVAIPQAQARAGRNRSSWLSSTSSRCSPTSSPTPIRTSPTRSDR
jgi:hypothetical protein